MKRNIQKDTGIKILSIEYGNIPLVECIKKTIKDISIKSN